MKYETKLNSRGEDSGIPIHAGFAAAFLNGMSDVGVKVLPSGAAQFAFWFCGVRHVVLVVTDVEGSGLACRPEILGEKEDGA